MGMASKTCTTNAKSLSQPTLELAWIAWGEGYTLLLLLGPRQQAEHLCSLPWI